MVPDPQLLTKQVIATELDAVGKTIAIGFNLPRGKVARIWGMQWGVFQAVLGGREYTTFVRKTANSPRQAIPKDILWSSIVSVLAQGASFATVQQNNQVMFPKPYRTVGITVQMHCSVTSTSSGLLVLYYDIDSMIPGEATEVLEKSVLRGIARRTREFD